MLWYGTVCWQGILPASSTMQTAVNLPPASNLAKNFIAALHSSPANHLRKDLIFRRGAATSCTVCIRSAGVSYEGRQDSLGHRLARMTTHYSAAGLHNLIAMAERVVETSASDSVLLVVLKRRANCKKSGKTLEKAVSDMTANLSKSLKSLVAEEGLEPPTRGL